VRCRAALLASLLFALTACSPPANESASTDRPAFAATDEHGRPVDLSALRGQVVLLNAWATWCKPCRQEKPYLSALQVRERERGLRVIGVSIDELDDRAQVLEAGPRLGISYDIWLDPQDRIAALTGTTVVPASVLIDREGAIVWRHTGVLREDTPGFVEALEAVIARN